MMVAVKVVVVPVHARRARPGGCEAVPESDVIPPASFLNEVAIAMSVNHPHLVSLGDPLQC
jgi:hypothetical protein